MNRYVERKTERIADRQPRPSQALRGDRGARHNGNRPAPKRLSHDEASVLLVDFELGRLSSRYSSAVEQHIRTCEICQKQGLNHAATERRKIIRKLNRVRPTRKMFARRMRGLLLILLIAVLFELVVFELLQPNSTLHMLLGGSSGTVPTANPTPTSLIYRDATRDEATVRV